MDSAQQQSSSTTTTATDSYALSTSSEVKNVWMFDVCDEFNKMSNLKAQCDHITVSVKHLGNIESATGLKEKVDNYDMIKHNVNHLPPIQIALSFLDGSGNIANTWQFNMKLDEASESVTDDMVGTGFNFKEHRENGVKFTLFSKLLLSNGFVSDENITWIGFNSGNDFGYLVKILTGVSLPDQESQFLVKFHSHFPKMYDVRHLMTACKNLSGTLDHVAHRLRIERTEFQNFASSNSTLISKLFIKIKDFYFENMIAPNYNGRIYNLAFM